MLTDELVKFLNNNFPDQLGEINAAMDLLIESIDDAAEVVAAKGNKLSLDKEFKDAAVLMSRADELQTLSKKVEDYAGILGSEEIALVSEDEAIEDIEKTYPNYSDYEVDSNDVHTLHENYVHKRPYAFELKGRKIHVNKWKAMLIETCNVLADINLDIIKGFPNNPRFKGRKSQYFRSKDPGSMRSPLKLEGLDMYVETNFSANDIRNLIIRMIRQYRIPTSEYKIYLRADYTGLHQERDNDGNGDKKGVTEGENKQKQQGIRSSEVTGGCMEYVRSYLNLPLTRHTKTTYKTNDQEVIVVCLVSRGRDTGNRTEYWFGLRKKQKKSLEACKKPYLALACGSANKIIFVPYTVFRSWLDDMSISHKMQDTEHWNIAIIEEKGKYTLRLRSGTGNVDLTGYVLAAQ